MDISGMNKNMLLFSNLLLPLKNRAYYFFFFKEKEINLKRKEKL
jgi:hypothetical protein